MRRSWSVLVALALFTGVLLAQPSSAAPALAASSSRLTVTPAKPMRGETFTITGKLSSKVVRPVALQRKAGKRWRTVVASVTAADGRFTFRSSTVTSAVSLRVVAKKVKVGRKTYKKVISSTRKVSTAAQVASLSMPTGAFVNQSIIASISLSPARAGRPLRLEVLTSAVWVEVANGFELATGKSDITLTAKTIGSFSYRAVAPPWNGAATVTSAVSTVTITPDQVTVNPEARDLTPAEESRIAGYDPTTGTLTVDSAPSSMASITRDSLLTLAPRSEAPSGALRKVTGVTEVGSTTTITTAEASLPQVIENVPDAAAEVGLSVLSSSFSPADGVTTQSVPRSPRLVRASGVQPMSVGELKLVVSKKWVEGGASAELAGEISIAPVVDLELDMDFFRLKSYKLGAGIQAVNKLTASVAYKASAGKRYTLGTLTQVLSGAIGPVPVWVQANLDIYVSWTINGSLEITAELSQSGRISAGITSSGDFDLAPKIYTTTADAKTALVDLKASGELGLFAGAEANLMLYSLAGPYATLGAEFDATIDGSLGTGFTCKVVYGPHAEAGLKTGGAIEKLTGRTYSVEAQLIKPTTTSNLCPTTPPPPPPPTGDPLAISTVSLPAATVGEAYSAALVAAGGTPPYQWTATGLPEGIALDSDGTLSGATAAPGSYPLTVTVTDASAATASTSLQLDVLESQPPVAAISLDKQAGPPSGNTPGSTITYTFVVTNTGNVDLNSIEVADPKVGIVMCPSGSLSPGAVVTCSAGYTMTAVDVAAGQVMNSAVAVGTPASGPAVVAMDSVTTSVG